MENCWVLLQYPWLKIHPAKYNNWLQYWLTDWKMTDWLTDWLTDWKMALSNTKPTSNSSILYPFEHPQTDLGDFASFKSSRKVISICCHTTPAFSTTTEVVSQRLIQWTDSINFIDRTNVPENTILVSMDVTSLYTNIPQEREYSISANHRYYKCKEKAIWGGQSIVLLIPLTQVQMLKSFNSLLIEFNVSTQETSCQNFFSNPLYVREFFFWTIVLCRKFFLTHLHLQDIFLQNHPTSPPHQKLNGWPLISIAPPFVKIKNLKK